MARSYNLAFKGYRREPNWSSLPSESGIYCVHAATRLAETGELTRGRHSSGTQKANGTNQQKHNGLARRVPPCGLAWEVGQEA